MRNIDSKEKGFTIYIEGWTGQHFAPGQPNCTDPWRSYHMSHFDENTVQDGGNSRNARRFSLLL